MDLCEPVKNLEKENYEGRCDVSFYYFGDLSAQFVASFGSLNFKRTCLFSTHCYHYLFFFSYTSYLYLYIISLGTDFKWDFFRL